MSILPIILSQFRSWLITFAVVFFVMLWVFKKQGRPNAGKDAFGCGCLAVLASIISLFINVVDYASGD